MKDNSLLYSTTALFSVGLVCSTVLSFLPGDHGLGLTAVGMMVTTGVGFLITHFKVQSIESKVDANTEVTVKTKDKITQVEGFVQTIEKQTNGELTKRLAEAAALVVAKTAEAAAETVATTAKAAALAAAEKENK
jgi:hypothetical protein